MTFTAVYHLAILLGGMSLLMLLVVRGKSIFVVAPLCALVTATLSGLNRLAFSVLLLSGYFSRLTLTPRLLLHERKSEHDESPGVSRCGRRGGVRHVVAGCNASGFRWRTSDCQDPGEPR